MLGVGNIVTVKIIGTPVQPFKVGVTVIVPVMFEPVLFAGAVQFAMLPVPLAPSPIFVFVFDQLKVEPVGVLAKLPMLID